MLRRQRATARMSQAAAMTSDDTFTGKLTAEDTLQSLAVRQHNLVTRAQLHTFGIDDMTMYRRVRNGLWQRLLPAVYAIHNGQISEEQRRVAAALYAGMDCQLAGMTALEWYGFRYVPEHDSIYLLAPHRVLRKSTGFVRIQRTHEMDDVCSPARAVVDAGRGLRD